MSQARFAIGRVMALCACTLAGAWSLAAVAEDEESLASHKVVIQVSTADPATQKMALNNAVNLQKDLGPDNVDIEIVAYGPGLSLMTKAGPEAERIPSLITSGIQFDACGNTIKKVESETGKQPQLIEGVKVVPAGVVRIMELQEKGYSYIRP